VEVAIFVGTLGLFFHMYFLFIRFVPVIAIAEVKGVMKLVSKLDEKLHPNNSK